MLLTEERPWVRDTESECVSTIERAVFDWRMAHGWPSRMGRPLIRGSMLRLRPSGRCTVWGT
jgi:hypothetical protein